MTQSMDLKDSNATEKFGEQLGRKLQGGEVIELISDLGGGKTTLTRGIARGAGSSDTVGSPTFMISKLYKATKCEIHHFDLYRLSHAGMMEYAISEVLQDPRAVLVIEWGEVLEHVLPKNRITIKIHKTSDDGRRLECHYSKNMAYLMEKS